MLACRILLENQTYGRIIYDFIALKDITSLGSNVVSNLNLTIFFLSIKTQLQKWCWNQFPPIINGLNKIFGIFNLYVIICVSHVFNFLNIIILWAFIFSSREEVQYGSLSVLGLRQKKDICQKRSHFPYGVLSFTSQCCTNWAPEKF